MRIRVAAIPNRKNRIEIKVHLIFESFNACPCTHDEMVVSGEGNDDIGTLGFELVIIFDKTWSVVNVACWLFVNIVESPQGKEIGIKI